MNHYTEVLELLVVAGTDLNAPDASGETPFDKKLFRSEMREALQAHMLKGID